MRIPRTKPVIRNYQDMAVNAWPALETMIYHGWLLRFADGFTKRSNSVYPMTCSGHDIHGMIDYCEAIYFRKGLDTVFRMTEAAEPEGLDEELARRGYRIVDPVSVQTVALGEIPNPKHQNIKLYHAVHEEWLTDFCRLQPELVERKDTMRQMFSRIVPERCFATIMTDDGEIAACGFSVLQDGHAGLFDIFTNPRLRRQGFAESIISHLLQWATQRGAHTAYLQVVRNNEKAWNLYRKLGFQELYGEWYRVKRRNDG